MDENGTYFYCPVCKARNEKDAKSCNSCGAELYTRHTPDIAEKTTPLNQKNEKDDQQKRPPLKYITKGTVFDNKYEIVRLIGKGGMGSVYEAREIGFNIDRIVAVKVLSPELLMIDNTLERRFIEEIKISARMDHPNIVHIYSAGKEGSILFLVMKYIQGKTLTRVVANNSPLPEKIIRTVALQIAGALNYIHKQGTIHRDIKGNNIILDENNFVTLMDFGIALSEDAHTRLTASGNMVGTGPYLSPEQWNGKQDQRSDIYSFGVVLYELAAGRLPFESQKLHKLMNMVLSRPAPAIRKFRQDLSEDLCEIIHRCLRKDPDERFQNMRELLLTLNGNSEGVIFGYTSLDEEERLQLETKETPIAGNVTAAFDRLEKAKKERPGDPLIAQLEDEYRRMSHDEQATLSRIKELVRLDERSKAVETAEEFLSNYHSRKVAEDLSKLKKYIAKTEDMFTRAEVFRLQKQPSKAKALYEQVIERDSNHEKARDILLTLGDVEAEAFDDSDSHTKSGLWKLVKWALKIIVVLGFILFFLPECSPSVGGRLNEIMGDIARRSNMLSTPSYFNAYSCYERSKKYLEETEKETTHLVLKQNDVVRLLIQSGDSALENENYTKALELYTEVLKLRPTNQEITAKIEKVTGLLEKNEKQEKAGETDSK